MVKTYQRAAKPAGTTIRLHGKDGAQVVRTAGHRWSDEAEAKFLDHLAASCNVKASAAATGFAVGPLYQRRRRDPGFAERWQAALEQGYVRIEELLVRRATEALEGHVPDPGMPLLEMTVRDAISILGQHRNSVKGEGRRQGRRGRPRTLEEMRDSILLKLEAIETQRRREAEEAKAAAKQAEAKVVEAKVVRARGG